MIWMSAYVDKYIRVGKEKIDMKDLSKFKMMIVVLLTLGFLLSGCAVQNKHLERVGRVAMIEHGKINEFKELHKAVQPEALEKLRKHNIYNYSIYLKDLGEAKAAMFGYFESTGDSFDADVLHDEKGLHSSDMEEVFYFAGKTDARVDKSKVQRYGMVIGLRPEMVEPYKLLHKYSWPEVLDAIEKGNIRNYSIYLHKLDDKFYLFSYFEYVGSNFEADMAAIDNDPATIAWMKFTDAGCQLPIPTRAEGEWWANMEEIFHCD